MLGCLKERPVKNQDELFETAQVIYTVCFEEVVRQVSIHC
jgi:hypothetical protein